MINFKKDPNHRYLELGGGDNPHPQCDVNCDVRPGSKVHVVADFDKPLPIRDAEYDVVFSQYALEHLSWRNVRSFLKEVFRVTKPGGKLFFITANTEAQCDFVKSNPDGWDGKSPFESFSCVLFGDQDYPENTHKNYMSPTIAHNLFTDAGFESVQTQSWGERATDISILASRPVSSLAPVPATQSIPVPQDKPQIMFDKRYFGGGGPWGGYAREGYWDYPVHEITFQHILARQPKSVLELGTARGYLIKRLNHHGIPSRGYDVSKHCFLTRASNGMYVKDLWNGPLEDVGFDLAFSIAFFEHVPEDKLPTILKGLAKSTERGLHGIDFGQNDDGFDKTHVSLKSQSWWRQEFDKYGLQSHEIVDKEELERGHIPQYVIQGDGKKKLNLGSFTTMFHHGWVNVDIPDLTSFANHHNFRFHRADLNAGVPCGTSEVDAIFLCHVLEHFSYQDGLKLLKDCRRVMKRGSVMRIIVPDATILLNCFYSQNLGEFDEINDGCAQETTQVGKLHALLNVGHHAIYDNQKLQQIVEAAGFVYTPSSFEDRYNDKKTPLQKQILRETIDMLPCLSLYAWATTP
jgi:predicted SAM-dependent methyltransferase